MTRETVTRFIARLSFFERELAGAVTSARDAVDIVFAWFLQRDFAHSIVTQTGFAVGVLIALRTDWQRVEVFTNRNL